MAWLGLSIPTLPGSSKKPKSRHPGARNIEEDEEEDQKPDSDHSSSDTDDESSDKPARESKRHKFPFRKPIEKGN